MLYRDVSAPVACRQGCTDCCGVVPWTGEEVARVADRLPPGAEITRSADTNEYLVVDMTRPLKCPFSREGSCAVYEDRPFLCRAFGQVDVPNHMMTCPHGAKPRNPMRVGKLAALTSVYVGICDEPRLPLIPEQSAGVEGDR